MKKIVLVLLVLMMVIGLSAERLPRVEVHKINKQFTKFTIVMSGWYVNTLAFDGPDGLVLVDTGSEDTAEELKKKLFKIYKKYPRYIINTHEHLDHNGGNAVFGLEPIIISHTNMRREMVEKFILNEYGPESLPDICFSDSLTLHLNGEDIVLKSFIGSHTESDIIVHFKKSKIIATSDLVYKNGFPSFSAYSGDVFEYEQVLNKLVDYCPKDVTFINGHTSDCGYEELVEYRNMVVETISAVKTAFKNKDGLEKLKNSSRLKKWKEWKKEGYIGVEEWINDLYGMLKNAGPRKIDITRFLYKALKNKGLKGFFDEYLKYKNLPDVKKYNVDYFTFGGFGYYFEKKKNYQAAEKIYSYGLKEYPKSLYAYIYLIEFYDKQNQKKEAVKFLKKLLKVFPESKWGKRKQKKLFAQK